MNTDPITAFAAAFQRIQEQVQRIEELEARLARLEQASTRPPRFREIRKTSPGLELPIPLAYLPGAYYLEQAIHAMLWPFRIRWIGSGKTEWFLGLPGVVGLVVYIIIGSYG